MKIRELRCEQFAGLRDRACRFDDGLNLIIGGNESGKSTLVDLLYHLFFQSPVIDGRRDREFRERYFPRSTGEWQGDTIDGAVRFETDKGVYRLSKEWSGKNGTARLTLPDGATLRDPGVIDRVLADALGYGKGVYSELVFASQRREQTILRGLLGSSPDAVNELAAAITKAVMETGGIEIDAMETELRERVRSYEGHWDFANDAPTDGVKKRGIGNRWKVDVGSILDAYYRKETIAAAQSAAERAERAVEQCNAELRSARERCEQSKARRERFSGVRSRITALNANRRLLASGEAELRRMRDAFADRPQKELLLARAEALKEQLRQAETRSQYETVRKLTEARDAVRAQLDALGAVRAEDLSEAEGLERAVSKLEATLRGMNLSARVRRLGDREILIRSSATGQSVPLDGERLEITEATEIVVPDAVEILLAPKGVDADAVGRELREKQARLRAILDESGAASPAELRRRQERARELGSELRLREAELRAALGGRSWEELSAEAAAIPDGARDPGELRREIARLCGGSLEAFIGKLSADVARYEQQFGPQERLSADIDAKARELEELRRRNESAGQTPEEFARVEDPDAFDAELKADVEAREGEIEDLRKRLSAAERELSEKSAEDYSEEARAAEAVFEERKAEYRRWKHIQAVFLEVKKAAKGDPLGDVALRFGEYLSELSGGTIALGSVREDLGSEITSGSSRLTADILSDGTKDTISLAFRLAVLRHLFPEGGCVAVFDDPFTDMDPRRTAEACRLIRAFAEDNQVIFVSCDEKYAELLQGNLIRIER